MPPTPVPSILFTGPLAEVLVASPRATAVIFILNTLHSKDLLSNSS